MMMLMLMTMMKSAAAMLIAHSEYTCRAELLFGSAFHTQTRVYRVDTECAPRPTVPAGGGGGGSSAPGSRAGLDPLSVPQVPLSGGFLRQWPAQTCHPGPGVE